MDINEFQRVSTDCNYIYIQNIIYIYIYIGFSGFELISIDLMHLVPSDLNGLQLILIDVSRYQWSLN